MLGFAVLKNHTGFALMGSPHSSTSPKDGSASHREFAFTLNIANDACRVLVKYQLVIFLLGRTARAANTLSREILLNNVAVVSSLSVILESNRKLLFLVFVPIICPGCAGTQSLI